MAKKPANKRKDKSAKPLKPKKASGTAKQAARKAPSTAPGSPPKQPRTYPPSQKKGALSPLQEAFVREYLIDLNATAAAERAGYSKKTARSIGSENLTKPDIQIAIQKAMAERAARTEIDADRVVKELVSVAFADANELIELRRTCCRYCHGKQFQHQRTAGEMKRDKAGWEALAEKAKLAGQDAPLFDPMGGIGYDARKAPHPDCQECFGEGVVVPFPKDTRFLSERSRRLYAGVKVTKDGIEVKMRDQDAALLNLAKHLGLFVNKHEHSGPEGAPIPISIIRFNRLEPVQETGPVQGPG